jgi:signal transduction histidine kinase
MNDSSIETSGHGPERASVLVVDDEARNVMLLKDLLESRGYAVLTAADGETGLALALERVPDVVLLDVMMPRLNGFEVCRQLKAAPGTAMIPVLLVTALDARADRLAGIDAGASDFLTKPIDSGDLILRVRNAVTTKKLYDQVAQQFRRLQELEAVRDSVTHMIVHDLRSPLTGLQAYLDLLSGVANGNREVADYALEAHKIAGLLKELVSQVLDVSRLEAGQMPLSTTNVDLARLLPAAVASLGPPAEGISIVYEIYEKQIMAACDQDLISRVIVNLVGNAFKFASGKVRIGLSRHGNRVRITVADDGPGVPEKFREMIFEKFGQTPLGQSTARSTGLGLAFCRLAVKAHQGEIGFEPAETGGACFWVDLPLKPAESGSPL